MCDIISCLEVYIIQLNALPTPSFGRAAKSGGRSKSVRSVIDIVFYVEACFVSLGSFRSFRPRFEKQRSHAAPAQFKRSGNTDRASARDAHVKRLLKDL
ncbi:hypothetical protein ASD02_33375 [Ensifer sp. Root1252]|nr:hypothetical protein ASD00_30855 [Ensifer sp. Root31]KQW49692.1 hypothetical protein ASD02_33375 [Ensifer sp. Root1252]KQW66617.1 hypothetical protein ASD03_34715 [Ensifer sp. Root127]KQY67648.1 hypothetical protein ASD52_34070 [Ensifer sp. Root142]KRC72888.1 hypothetical protein ASE32_33075 [Ensifer sp. Root231]KRC94119.1 hypothetical protein ASE47_34230 [Ensifer sp. Root258]